jgi:hypothetical protein
MKRQIAVPVAVALACAFVDVYLFGLPMTMWGLALVAFVHLVQLSKHAAGPDASLAAVRTKRVVIYGAGVALIFLGILGNVKLAAARGARVAAAVKQYRAANGDYPERLGQLVPGYLAEIPSCCIRAKHAKFDYYRPRDKTHSILFWVAVFHFGKGSYFFESDELKPLWD